jgi:hypothetical protein
MPRIAFWKPSLHAFGTPQDNFRLGSRMKDDIVQRGSGFSETRHQFGSSFSGGSSGVANLIQPVAGSVVGEGRLQYNILVGGGQNAGVTYGYIGGNAPWRLDPNYDYIFTAKLRCASLLLGGATLIYEFCGLGVNSAVTNNFTSGIGFIRDDTTFAGDRYRFEPICRDGGGSTRINNAQSFCLFAGDPVGGIYRSWMWKASHNGSSWTVSFYKLWDNKNTVGAAGEWIFLGNITTNIPTGVSIGFFHQCLVTTTTIGTSGVTDWFIDYVTFEQRNKSVWRYST